MSRNLRAALAMLLNVGASAATQDIPGQAPILGLALLHPLKFPSARLFDASYSRCTALERAGFQVMWVFSSGAIAKQYGPSNVSKLALDRMPPGERLPRKEYLATKKMTIIWKRWFALALLIDQKQLTKFEYVVLLDADILILSCERLAQLPARVRAHESAKRWTAVEIRDDDHWQEAPRFSAAGLQAAASGGEHARLHNSTRQFRLYPWFSELPYVPVASVVALIDHWRQRPSLWPYASAEPPPHNASYRDVVSLYQPGAATAEAAARKQPEPESHLTCLAWRILHEGLRVESISELMDPTELRSVDEQVRAGIPYVAPQYRVDTQLAARDPGQFRSTWLNYGTPHVALKHSSVARRSYCNMWVPYPAFTQMGCRHDEIAALAFHVDRSARLACPSASHHIKTPTKAHEIAPGRKLNVKLASWEETPCHSRIAMHDSEGFFDDIPEKAWREVQSAHNLQMLSQGDRGSTRQHIDKLTTSPSADWWTLNWEPSLTCQAQRRIGRAGDGGKWVCDPHRITEKATKEGCLVYSIGSFLDFSFEEAVFRDISSSCEIHTFDCTVNATGATVPNFLTFHRLCITGGDGHQKESPMIRANSATLDAVRAQLGHTKRTLDILKIDCEGCELWSAALQRSILPPSIQSGTAGELPFVPIRQVLMEVHGTRDNSQAPREKLLKTASASGFAMFHKEPNIWHDSRGRFCEVSLLKMSLDFFSRRSRRTQLSRNGDADREKTKLHAAAAAARLKKRNLAE